MPKRSVLIAVVDDEESVRKALGRLISAAGFDVQIFSSGPDFLRSTQQRPHCVVLDVRMPHMDGFEVQRTLMRADEPVPVIIITGDDSADCRARALQQGAKAYLRKPVDDALLLEAIESALLPGSRESGAPR
jgi:FixJ family two-component response regulator